MIDEKLLLEKIELLRSKCEHGRQYGKMRAFEECETIIRAMVPYDKELEQAAQQYEYNHDGLPWGESKERLTDAFKDGAQWQKQQMMKDAIVAMSKTKELLDKAFEFIVETQDENDYICEQMCEEYVGDYCANNCQNLNKECVKLFLEKVYKKHE